MHHRRRVRVLVCNRSDPASVNLRDQIVAMGDWELTNRTFRGRPMLSQSEAILIEVDGPTVTDEALNGDLLATNLPLRDVWFLSKHRAESGTPSLTVHPIGNHGDARFGGRNATLSPAASRDMGSLLRRIKFRRDEAGLPHEVTYEATHHGPHMTLPSVFVEIGSDEKWYSDPASGQVVARAIQDVLGGEGRSNGPVLVSVGGGHYVPRATDIAVAGLADFGHFLPAHAVESTDGPELLQRAIAATPDFEAVHIHKKGLKGPARQKVVAWCEELGVPVWERPTNTGV